MTVYNDEIDLRPYLDRLLKFWWLVAVIALLAAGVVLALGLSKPRLYQASANILFTRSRSQLALAEQFPTVSEPVDQKARMEALITIVESDSFAVGVQENLLNSARLSEITPGDLKKKVKVSSDGDLLVITATSEHPQDAAEIANAWAEAAVKAINLAYYEGQPLDTVQTQLALAKTQAANSQAALEEFLQTNPAVGLQAELGAAQQALEVVSGLSVRELNFYASQKLAMERISAQAKILKAQVEAGGASNAAQVGDALSVLLTRLQAFDVQPSTAPSISDQSVLQEAASANSTLLAQRETLVMNLSLDQASGLIGSTADLARDVDNLIALADAEARRADERIQELTQTSSSAEDQPNWQNLSQKVQMLAARVETARARENELIGQRDLDWATYQALLAKEAEIKNATSLTSNTSLASRAVAPTVPVSRSLVRNVLVAALLGAVAAIIGLLAVTWWNSFRHTARPTDPAR